MSTYREIHGKAVKSLDTDPSATTDAGQIWYNTGSDTFKSIVSTSAWASASPLITGVYGSMQFGLQTAGVAASGSAGPGPTTATQEYNGSGWNSGGNVGSQRYRGGAGGTLTAGVIFGGEAPPGDSTATEEYDGSSWTNGGAMTKARRTTGIGIQTAASAVGGYDNSNKLATVEDYNGSSWTSGTNLPLSGTIDSGSGLTSSARVAGGQFGPGSTHPPSSPQTFNNNIGWDGTSWSNDTALSVNRFNNSGFGTSSDDYYTAGGRNPSPATLNTTVYWNGSAWSSAPNLATARYNGQGINGTPTAFFFAGGNPGEFTNTEEFNNSANVITAAAWASGPSINTARRGGNAGAVGSSTAGLIWCGVISPGGLTNATEEYNGSSWSSSNNYPISAQNVGGAGTQTAGIGFGGSVPPQTTTANDYNGTSWTGITAMPTATWIPSGTGTAAAALSTGGTNPSGASTTTTLEWDDSSWTAGGSLSTGRRYFAGFGSQSDSLAPGGTTAPGAISSVTEKYNGSTWSSGNAMVTTIRAHAASAQSSTSAGLNINGTTNDTSSSAATFEYDGTSWRTNANTAATRLECFAIGDSTSAHVVSGISPWPSPGAVVTSTETFSPETTALNVKTLTQS